jgi:hypothetical protein
MTTLTDIKAITPTANAKSVVQAKGADISSLMLQLQQHASELQVIVRQVIAVHPSGGGDAANLTALNNVLTALL